MGLRDLFRKREKIPSHDFTKTVPVPDITRIVNEKRYSSLDAKCIAQGMVGMIAYGWLMQSNNNRFFMIYQGFMNGTFHGVPLIEAIEDFQYAKKCYELCMHQLVPYEQVFDVKVVDA